MALSALRYFGLASFANVGTVRGPLSGLSISIYDHFNGSNVIRLFTCEQAHFIRIRKFPLISNTFFLPTMSFLPSFDAICERQGRRILFY